MTDGEVYLFKTKTKSFFRTSHFYKHIGKPMNRKYSQQSLRSWRYEIKETDFEEKKVQSCSSLQIASSTLGQLVIITGIDTS